MCRITQKNDGYHASCPIPGGTEAPLARLPARLPTLAFRPCRVRHKRSPEANHRVVLEGEGTSKETKCKGKVDKAVNVCDCDASRSLSSNDFAQCLP